MLGLGKRKKMEDQPPATLSTAPLITLYGVTAGAAIGLIIAGCGFARLGVIRFQGGMVSVLDAAVPLVGGFAMIVMGLSVARRVIPSILHIRAILKGDQQANQNHYHRQDGGY